MKPSQIGGAALPRLVGSWKYVNETYSGIIKYGKVGDFHLTIPSRNGAQGPRISQRRAPGTRWFLPPAPASAQPGWTGGLPTFRSRKKSDRVQIKAKYSRA